VLNEEGKKKKRPHLDRAGPARQKGRAKTIGGGQRIQDSQKLGLERKVFGGGGDRAKGGKILEEWSTGDVITDMLAGRRRGAVWGEKGSGAICHPLGICAAWWGGPFRKGGRFVHGQIKYKGSIGSQSRCGDLPAREEDHPTKTKGMWKKELEGRGQAKVGRFDKKGAIARL